MTDTHLHTFRCANCQTVLTCSVKGRYNCNMCHQWMKFLFSQPIESDADRALAARGPVWNPGASGIKPKCPQCDKTLSLLYRVRVEDIWFCSEKCSVDWHMDSDAPAAELSNDPRRI